MYNDIVVHETLRVGVCDVMERRLTYPDDLFEMIKLNFLEQYDDYLNICKMKASKNGQSMSDPFGGSRGLFQYNILNQRLEKIHDSL